MPDNFWINSLGEYGWGSGDRKVGGSVYIGDMPNLSREEQNAVADVRLRKQVEERCNEDEAKLYWRHAELTDRFQSDRWRFYASISPEHGAVIGLSTEFKHDEDDETFWTSIADVAREFNAKVEHMFDWDEEGERQVSVEWDVTSMTIPSIGALIRNFEQRTQAIWENAGVSVI